MFKELFINATILTFFLFILFQIFREKSIYPAEDFVTGIISGLIYGVLGSTLMLFSVGINKTTIIDFRNVAEILASFSGIYCVTISAVMIAAFRILYFGVNLASVMAAVNAFIQLIIYSWIVKMKIKDFYKWTCMMIINIVTVSIIFVTNIKGTENIILTTLFYAISNILAGMLVYYFYNYMIKINNLYRKLEKESKQDFLTGLNNVRQFDNYLNDAMKNAVEKDEKLSFLFIDIDHFKKVNDTYGHKSGDEILIQLSNIMKKSSRSIDIVSRNGGEEFSLILPYCSIKNAYEIAEKLRKNVEEYDFTISGGKIIKITISVGVSCYKDTVSEVENLVTEADNALYRAKREGRNRVC